MLFRSDGNLAYYYLVLAFALPGLFNHDPWKAFDVISIELIQQMHRTGQWLVPQLAGEAWLQISPLYLWVGLLFAKLGLALSLPLHAVVRLASLLCLGIACVNVYRSAARSAIRPADAPTSASAAVAVFARSSNSVQGRWLNRSK